MPANVTDNWKNFKNILCIRADNIGDLLMSYPAIRALKESFNSRITLLTSPMAKPAAECLEYIDELIIFDFPWVKTTTSPTDRDFSAITGSLRSRNFDAAVIFTVYSQNPLPTAMLAYSAGIPNILAYCRENPYELINYWLPDGEPYSFMQHQVQRDLNLVKSVGAATNNNELSISISDSSRHSVAEKLNANQISIEESWILLHPGVSEKKREYAHENWVTLGRKLASAGHKLIITGTASEREICNSLASAIGSQAVSMSGLFTFNEFVAAIELAPLVISVNTATIHIAAATSTPVIVLYALSNPQHLPWKAKGKFFAFQIDQSVRSRNEVIKFVHQEMDRMRFDFTSEDVYEAAISLLVNPGSAESFPELIL